MPPTDPFFASCDCSHVTTSSQSGRSRMQSAVAHQQPSRTYYEWFLSGRWFATADCTCRPGLATSGHMSTVARCEKWVRPRHRNGLFQRPLEDVHEQDSLEYCMVVPKPTTPGLSLETLGLCFDPIFPCRFGELLLIVKPQLRPIYRC